MCRPSFHSWKFTIHTCSLFLKYRKVRKYHERKKLHYRFCLSSLEWTTLRCKPAILNVSFLTYAITRTDIFNHNNTKLKTCGCNIKASCYCTVSLTKLQIRLSVCDIISARVAYPRKMRPSLNFPEVMRHLYHGKPTLLYLTMNIALFIFLRPLATYERTCKRK